MHIKNCVKLFKMFKISNSVKLNHKRYYIQFILIIKLKNIIKNWFNIFFWEKDSIYNTKSGGFFE